MVSWRELWFDDQNVELKAVQVRIIIGTVKHRGKWGRAVSLTTSPDFRSWTTPEPIFEADDEDQERAGASIRARLANPMLNQPTSNDPADYGADVYNMGLFRYESIFLGFPAFFHHTGRNAQGNNHDGFHLVQLVASRDRRSWQRVGDRQPFIGSSPLGAGAYDLTTYAKRDFAPKPQRLRSVIAILKKTPESLAAARVNLEEHLPKVFITTAIEQAKSVRRCISHAAACVSASSIITPGRTGKVGKWSARYSSARLTYFTATIRSSDRCSILSTRLNFTQTARPRPVPIDRPRRKGL